MRTFVLFALLGTLAAEIQIPLLTFALSTFVFIAILLGYLHATKKRKAPQTVGLTTEMAAGVVFCLGFLSFSKPLLACMLGGIVLIILIGKKRLHTFARHQLKTKEIQAAITIIIIGVGVLPFLPNHTIDPWELINPRRFGFLVLLLSLIQFGGYIAIRVFGQRFGTIMMGFFGGLVSSTAVFATLSRLSRQQVNDLRAMVTAAVFSILGMLIEFVIIISAAAPKLINTLLLPIIAIATVGASSALLTIKPKQGKKHSKQISHPTTIANSPNPLDVKSVLTLAAFIAIMLLLSTIAGRYFGQAGIQYVTFFGGLFEVHGVSLATATLYFENKLALDAASTLLLIAIAASFVSKFMLLFSLARNRFAVITSLFLIAMVVAGGVAVFFI